jgi:hypothetical protein
VGGSTAGADAEGDSNAQHDGEGDDDAEHDEDIVGDVFGGATAARSDVVHRFQGS